MNRTIGFFGWSLAALVGHWTSGSDDAILAVPYHDGPIVVDGKLDEPFYQTIQPLTNFVDVADPTHPIPSTKAWVGWSNRRLMFAFDCVDATSASTKATENERDVDPQDRVELFLWSGNRDDDYYCIEIAARGAVHDYQARFYRKFDDRWKPIGLQYAVLEKEDGYCVEAILSDESMGAMALPLRVGSSFRAGLFRADFDRLDGTPTWISWIDAQAKEPDFHIAESFGTFKLSGGKGIDR